MSAAPVYSSHLSWLHWLFVYSASRPTAPVCLSSSPSVGGTGVFVFAASCRRYWCVGLRRVGSGVCRWVAVGGSVLVSSCAGLRRRRGRRHRCVGLRRRRWHRCVGLRRHRHRSVRRRGVALVLVFVASAAPVCLSSLASRSVAPLLPVSQVLVFVAVGGTGVFRLRCRRWHRCVRLRCRRWHRCVRLRRGRWYRCVCLRRGRWYRCGRWG